MKIINEDLLKLKIDIPTEIDEEYQDIAILVDKPDFLLDIQKVRAKLNVEVLLKPGYVHWWWEYLGWSKKNPKKDGQINKIAKELSSKYKRPTHKDVIIQTILFGVADGLYAPLVQVVGKHTKFNFPRIGIFPNERTTDKEIREALKQVNKYFSKGSIDFELKNPTIYTKRTKLHPFIRRQRFFHWERLVNKEPTQIADEWAEKHPNDKPLPDAKSVVKDYHSYRRLLKL